MLYRALTIVACLPALWGGIANAAHPAQRLSWDEAYARADAKLAELTAEEKAMFMRGYSTFYFYGVPQKGIPFLYLSDATQGVHIRRNLPDTTLVRQLDRSTQFPCPIMLAATFDPELSRRYAQAVGEECRAGGVEVLLGPGVNITNNAQNGRNYEYLGEDPCLASAHAAAYVDGMLSTGTMPCVKHFICNETQFYQRRSNSVVDERAIHEIYMPAFKAAIDAGCPYVMTAYNMVNGIYAGQNPYLINGLLRHELGFRGSVMSDWRSVYDPFMVVASGQNTVMPGNAKERAALDKAVAAGAITEAQIEAMIRPVLAVGYAFGLYDREKYVTALLDRFGDHAKVASEVASEGVVLLRNNGVLPIASGRKVLLAGKYLDVNPRSNNISSSSADVEGYDYLTLAQAMRREFGEALTVSAEPTDEELRQADVVVAVAGTTDVESFERPFALPKAEEAFLRRAVAANANTVVLMLTGSGVRMTGWNDRAAAVVYGWYPGQNGMAAVAAVLAGRVNPSGKLPLTIEREWADSPCHSWMPEGAEFYNSALRAYNEALIAPYDINYTGSVLVGYRWYEAKGITPLYAFGHGLSYTRFALSRPTVGLDGDKVRVSVEVANVGGRDGAEVVQVYVGEDRPAVVRPVKELKAFQKVRLAKGERKAVELLFDKSELSYWDDTRHCWRLDPGAYTVAIGTSSADIAYTLPLTIKP